MADLQNATKKISEATSDEIAALRKPLGFPGLPYPMAMLRRNTKGMAENTIGAIQSSDQPLVVYSKESVERINGMLIRQMPIPGMMFMLRDLLSKLDPDSKNRILTVFGDAAFGKSHLLKLVFSLSHPDGPISIDCGGMNMREVFFRTVIDYGQGVKEQFDKRVMQGVISRNSLDALEAEFPGSVVQNGTETRINWDAIGQPRQKDDGTGKKINDEDRGAAALRARNILTAVYEKEGINVQTNAFGIKTVPGEVFESIWTGRPIFLDEFNKSKPGTLDCFQTFLQFANGETDSVRIENPMATDGDSESPKYIELNRKDLRLGWGIGIAGNDKSDGATTQELSVSMMTRLDPKRVGEPGLGDWAHRISQVWTGLPLTTLYTMFKKTADSKPAEFAQWLISVRKLGLSADEVKAIPPHEIYLLQNFQNTVLAVNQVSNYYNERLQFANPNSKKYEEKANQDLADEAAAGADRVFVSFRRIIADFNRAVASVPEVRPASDVTLSLDLAQAFSALDLSAMGRALPAWYKLGVNMEAAIMENISNDTLGMPGMNAALMKICETNGIFPPDLKEAKPGKDVKNLAELLKYDRLKDLGGTQELMDVRSVLMSCLRSQNPNLKAKDDDVIPLENLGRVLKRIKDEKLPEVHPFILPNGDANTVTGDPIVVGRSLPNYLLDDPSSIAKDLKGEYAGYELADFRSALAALALPDYAEQNRKNLWPVQVDDYISSSGDADPEAMNTIKGMSKIGFNLVILAALDSSGKPAYLYVIDDKMRKKMMVVGPENIATSLQGDLLRNGITYVKKSDPASAEMINDFLSEGAKQLGTDGKLQPGNTNVVIENLIRGFSALCQLSHAETVDGQMQVNKGATLGQSIQDCNADPSIYTNIVRPKVGKPR